MSDVFTKPERSRIMSRVKGRDTRPELAVRSMLHRMGCRFRLHVRTLPGVPDIVMPRRRKIVFVHGCFWHGHENCRRAGRPSSNTEFWKRKLDGNLARDREQIAALAESGWSVLVVWECEIKNGEALREKLKGFVEE